MTNLNPNYVRSLDAIADQVLPLAAGPLTAEEAAWLGRPLYRTDHATLVSMRGGVEALKGEVDGSVPFVEAELLRGIVAPTLTRKRNKLAGVIAGWQGLPEEIRPQVAEVGIIGVFATRDRRDNVLFGNTESLGLYDEGRVTLTALTMRVIMSRFDQQRDLCAQEFGGDETAKLFKRVAKDACLTGDADMRKVADAFVEGTVSMAQAVSHIEADFRTRGFELPDDAELSRMIVTFTAALTYGYFGEMSLRGMYFKDLFRDDGTMDPKYKEFFSYLQTHHVPKPNGFVAANDGEGCPAPRKPHNTHASVLRRCLELFFAVQTEIRDGLNNGSIVRPRVLSFAPATLALSGFDRSDAYPAPAEA